MHCAREKLKSKACLAVTGSCYFVGIVQNTWEHTCTAFGVVVKQADNFLFLCAAFGVEGRTTREEVSLPYSTRPRAVCAGLVKGRPEGNSGRLAIANVSRAPRTASQCISEISVVTGEPCEPSDWRLGTRPLKPVTRSHHWSPAVVLLWSQRHRSSSTILGTSSTPSSLKRPLTDMSLTSFARALIKFGAIFVTPWRPSSRTRPRRGRVLLQFLTCSFEDRLKFSHVVSLFGVFALPSTAGSLWLLVGVK